MSEETEKETRPSPEELEEPAVELSDEELGAVAGGRDAVTGNATGRRSYLPVS